NLFVAGFLGAPKMNFIPAEVAQVVGSRIVVRLPDGAMFAPEVDAGNARIGDKVTLGVRPEHMAAGDTISLVVAHAEYLGDQTVAYGSMQGDPTLIAVKLAPDSAPPAPGSLLGVQLLPQRSHLFNAEGAAFLHPVTNMH
ncbi:MAG TPA: TOBE domain-containing protein, partial [Telluria sp.]